MLRERSDGDRIRVGTKGGLRRPKGAWTNDGTPRHIREACEKSLRALGVDQIFLYQFHAPDPAFPFEKSVETFAQLQQEGKCLHVGLSNVTVAHIGKASRIIEIASVQNRLNPYFREAIEEGVVAECERRDITFLAYSPVGGGRLSKKIPKFEVLATIANARGVSPWAVTQAWVRSKGKTVVPIPSATKPETAVDSAKSATDAPPRRGGGDRDADSRALEALGLFFARGSAQKVTTQQRRLSNSSSGNGREDRRR